VLLPTYGEISETFFYLRLPRGVTQAEHEAASGGEAERSDTARALNVFRRELHLTTGNFFHLSELPLSRQGLSLLDAHLTPGFIHELHAGADPDDPNNRFKLTLSEFAVYLGDVAAHQLGGRWQLARMPNYHESVVLCEGFELLAWDIVMKRASRDEGYVSLQARYEPFERAVLTRRAEISARLPIQ
jgi:hypothetical protein